MNPRVIEYSLGLYIKEDDLPRRVDVKGSLDVGDRTKHDDPLLIPVRIWYLSESSPFYGPAILGIHGWRGKIGNRGPTTR